MDSSLTASLEAGIAGLTNEKMKQDAMDCKELFDKYYPLIEADIWKQTDQSDDKTVISYTSKTDEGKVMAKGVGYIPFKPEKIVRFAQKMENRPLFDENFV